MYREAIRLQSQKAVDDGLADSGYDNNDYGERIEWDEKGRRTGKRFLCPENPRNTKKGRRKGNPTPAPKPSRLQRKRRRQRREFLQSRRVGNFTPDAARRSNHLTTG